MFYIINPGHSFLDSDGSTKTGGDTIALADDVAAAQRDKVTPCAAESADAPAAPDAPLQRIDYFDAK
jgi:hypothetical protein